MKDKSGETETLRLVDGPDSSSGRVEIFHEGEWGTICDDRFYGPVIDVICRQLGFPGAITYREAAEYGQGAPGSPILHILDCDGTETNINMCTFNSWDTIACSHAEDAGIVCQPGTSQQPFITPCSNHILLLPC